MRDIEKPAQQLSYYAIRLPLYLLAVRSSVRTPWYEGLQRADDVVLLSIKKDIIYSLIIILLILFYYYYYYSYYSFASMPTCFIIINCAIAHVICATMSAICLRRDDKRWESAASNHMAYYAPDEVLRYLRRDAHSIALRRRFAVRRPYCLRPTLAPPRSMACLRILYAKRRKTLLYISPNSLLCSASHILGFCLPLPRSAERTRCCSAICHAERSMLPPAKPE